MTMMQQIAAASRIQFAENFDQFLAAIEKSEENAFLKKPLELGDLSDDALAKRPLCMISAATPGIHKQFFYIQNDEGVIIAAAALNKGEMLAFEHMAVRPEEQGQGNATALMRAIMQHCVTTGQTLEAALYDAPNTDVCMKLYGDISREFPDLPIYYYGAGAQPVTVAEYGPYTLEHPHDYDLTIRLRPAPPPPRQFDPQDMLPAPDPWQA